MRIVFIGTGKIGVPTLTALEKSGHELLAVVTQPDKPAGRTHRLKASPIKESAALANLSILQPLRIKDPDSIAQIAALQPEIVVVVAYGQILPVALLTLPRLGCLNLHASLLPKWRGAAPIPAAIAAGDQETGITVMYVDQGLDTGDILLQRATTILPGENSAALEDRLAMIAPDALLGALQLLESGKAPRVPQDHAKATYAPKLNRESGQIDWSEPAQVIERKIRAFNPWPGAFTAIALKSGGPRNLKIFSATVVDRREQAGEVLREGAGIIVGAGNGALLLGEIQLEGKRRMHSAEFARGYPGLSKLVR